MLNRSLREAATGQAASGGPGRGMTRRSALSLAGMSGLLTTILGIALVFFPAQQGTSLWSYELWMFGGTLFFVGLAAFFFFVYGRHKAPQEIETGATLVAPR